MCPCVRYAVLTNWAHRNYHYGVGLLDNPTYIRNILASITSSWNHITCATNQENNYLFCFCFTKLRNSEDFYTCLASVRRKRNSHALRNQVKKKPPRFEGDQPKHRVSKHLFFKSQQGSKQMFFPAFLKIVLWTSFRKLSHLIVTNLNDGLTNKCSFRLRLHVSERFKERGITQ